MENWVWQNRPEKRMVYHSLLNDSSFDIFRKVTFSNAEIPFRGWDQTGLRRWFKESAQMEIFPPDKLKLDIDTGADVFLKESSFPHVSLQCESDGFALFWRHNHSFWTWERVLYKCAFIFIYTGCLDCSWILPWILSMWVKISARLYQEAVQARQSLNDFVEHHGEMDKQTWINRNGRCIVCILYMFFFNVYDTFIHIHPLVCWPDKHNYCVFQSGLLGSLMCLIFLDFFVIHPTWWYQTGLCTYNQCRNIGTFWL